jgi:SsrA-binding protein
VSNKKEKTPDAGLILARNPKARHDYHILDTWEAGIVLTGSEIKSLRDRKVNIKGAFATVRRGEVWLEGMNISTYENAGYSSHAAERSRKLLLTSREIKSLIESVEQKGFSLVPLDVHLTRGFAKVQLALGRGKKLHDKRHDLKERDAAMEINRSMGKRE